MNEDDLKRQERKYINVHIFYMIYKYHYFRVEGHLFNGVLSGHEPADDSENQAHSCISFCILDKLKVFLKMPFWPSYRPANFITKPT